MSKFLKFIVNVFLIFAILVACAILLPTMFGVTTTIVDSASMDTNLPYGSITYSNSVEITEIRAGDEILKDDDASTYAYVIKDIDTGTQKAAVVNAADENGDTQELNLVGTVSKVAVIIPYIGYVLIAMHSTQGVIIIALVVVLMVILFILSELWKEKPEDTKSEDEEEPEEEEPQASRSTETLNMELPPIEGASDIVVPEPETGDEEDEVSGDTLTVPNPVQAEGQETNFTEAAADPADDTVPSDSGLVTDVVKAADDNTDLTADAPVIVPDITLDTSEIVPDMTTDVSAAMALGDTTDDSVRVPDTADIAGDIPTIIEETEADDKGEVHPEIEVEETPEEEKTASKVDIAPSPAVAESLVETEPAATEDNIRYQEEQVPTEEDQSSETAVFSEAATMEVPQPDAVLEEPKEKPAEEPELERFTPVNRGTLEEILDQASRDGVKPKVSVDDPTGITLVDYSDVI